MKRSDRRPCNPTACQSPNTVQFEDALFFYYYHRQGGSTGNGKDAGGLLAIVQMMCNAQTQSAKHCQI